MKPCIPLPMFLLVAALVPVATCSAQALTVPGISDVEITVVEAHEYQNSPLRSNSATPSST